MKSASYELEFYFRRSEISDLRMLERIKEALAAAQVAYTLQEWDLERMLRKPQDVPVVPSLRRLNPRPERILAGPFSSQTEILNLLEIDAQLQTARTNE